MEIVERMKDWQEKDLTIVCNTNCEISGHAQIMLNLSLLSNKIIMMAPSF